MKITDTSKPPPPARVSGGKKANSAQAPAASVEVDEAAFAGIPAAELTPKVREALTSLMLEVRQLRSELEATRAQLSQAEVLADRDPLLDILNRRAFVRELDRMLAMIDRYDAIGSLVFIDLNDLKKTNDEKGHSAGDAVLAHVASVISANIRQTDVVGRLGGDEFGVLLTQADQETAQTKAEELSRLVTETPVTWKSEKLTVKISCGAVQIMKGVSATEALEHADTAMYEAKKTKS